MPLFGGTTAGKVAYAQDGSYVGDTGEVKRRIGADDNVRVDIRGDEVFGPQGADLFQVAANIAAKLVSNPDDLGTDLEALDAAMSRLTTSLADVGSRYNRLETGTRINKDAELSLQDSLSNIENVDMARAMVDLQMNEVAYQASLGATARVLQPSLLQFLR
jgi:flagellar hook-associated protein 3 FlgL